MKRRGPPGRSERGACRPRRRGRAPPNEWGRRPRRSRAPASPASACSVSDTGLPSMAMAIGIFAVGSKTLQPVQPKPVTVIFLACVFARTSGRVSCIHCATAASSRVAVCQPDSSANRGRRFSLLAALRGMPPCSRSPTFVSSPFVQTLAPPSGRPFPPVRTPGPPTPNLRPGRGPGGLWSGPGSGARERLRPGRSGASPGPG